MPLSFVRIILTEFFSYIGLSQIWLFLTNIVVRHLGGYDNILIILCDDTHLLYRQYMRTMPFFTLLFLCGSFIHIK
jgi:hypothetical protein